MLVSAAEMLKAAKAGKYAVGHFNINNLEWTKCILQVAEELHSPVILGVSEGAAKYMCGFNTVAAMTKEILKTLGTTVPVALHLDHGSYDGAYAAMKAGFSSVMFDGSHLPVDDNIEITKGIVEIAKEYGAAVEAEIGCVGGSEDGSEDIAINCTSPEQAKRFAEETKVDALAIAIGNAHGNYKETPHLRFDILEKVHSLVSVPLVLHGGTGISPEDFVRCHQNGIKKINIATATFDSVERSVRESYESGKIGGYYDLHQAEIEGAYRNAKKHMKIFYSVGKAEDIEIF